MPRQTKQKLHPAASRAVAAGHLNTAKEVCRCALDLVALANVEIRRVRGAGTAARAGMPTARAVANLFSHICALERSPAIRIDPAEERALLLDHGFTSRKGR